MTEQNETLILTAIPVGNPQFPRWKIADQNERYYSGTEWVTDPDAAMLYQHPSAVCEAIQSLQRQAFANKKRFVFVAPLVIEVYADNPVSTREVAEWSSKVARLFMDSNTFGIGPMEGTLALSRIHWSHLRKVDPQEMP